jgi:hypothetical protein
VPENLVRLTTGLVFLCSLAGLLLRSGWPFLFLAVDFALRAFFRPRWSPLAAFSRLVLAPVLKLPLEHLISWPRSAAAAIGTALRRGGAVLILGSLRGCWSAATAGWLSALGSGWFCAGCQLYGLGIRLGLIPPENCPECVVRGR